MTTARQAFETVARGPYFEFTARQVSILFILTRDEGEHTIRGMAAKLKSSRPAITRAINMFESMGLAKREPNPRDKRDVWVRPQEAAFELVRQIEGEAE